MILRRIKEARKLMNFSEHRLPHKTHKIVQCETLRMKLDRAELVSQLWRQMALPAITTLLFQMKVENSMMPMSNLVIEQQMSRWFLQQVR